MSMLFKKMITAEAQLGLWVFADVDGHLVLGVLNVSEHVFVCLPLEQVVHHFPVSIVRGVVQ